MPSNSSVSMSVTVHPDLRRRFRKFAASRGDDVAHQMRLALERHLAFPPPIGVPVPVPNASPPPSGRKRSEKPRRKRKS